MNLRITSVHIADTMGTTVANFTPGSVTRIIGSNGQGKSSILKALLYCFTGGLDPSIIRKGAEKSVVSFTLDNGVTVTKTTAIVKPRRGADPSLPVKYRADLEITDSDGSVIAAPQSYIAELSEALAVDPSVLLRIDSTTVPGKRALAAELMRLVPISFDPEEVNRACAYRSSDAVGFHERDALAIPESPDTSLALEGLKKIVTQITEQRRRIGITKSDTDGAVNRLQKSLPEDDGVDHSGKLHELETMATDIERAVADRRVEIEKAKSEALGDAKNIANTASMVADEEYAIALAALESKRNETKRTAREECSSKTQTIMSLTNDELTSLEAEARPHRERIAGELATTKERIQAHSKAAALREEIDIQLATCREAGWKYEQLTGVLANLEALRLEKLNHLPVAGLVVEDGEAFLDGIAWDKVNLARRVEAVLQICTQRSGKLPLVIIDDCEHLDTDTRAAVEEGLAEAGFQLIEAVVSDVPLRIEVK